ncbi:MAG: hypothetical protein KKA05_04215 [Alphaproteobacteria bacterium]|nr:hypothetical protein [Alphaproteobacteria bacterium]MBU0858411.1 hypothetical protein [Alphaproteobacteria bacterium]
MKKTPLKLVAAFAALPLLVACTPDDHGYVDTKSADSTYSLHMGGGEVNITEFTPDTAPDQTCVHVSPRHTWTGTAQACFTNNNVAATQNPTIQAQYKMASGKNEVLVTEFSPSTAPDVNCIHVTPRHTWTGTTLSCAPRP